VQEFLQDDLGVDGLARSVVVVATSDEPALMRRQAAYLTLSIAEYFRDQAQHVLLLMDSVTRFAMAKREIGLSVGEPPTSRGYTPSVFAELPKLMERCGTAESGGSITALYTVLVEGDDLNDPIADAVRSILDGHIVLSRELANHGHYPAIDLLHSISRLYGDLANAGEQAIAKKALAALSLHEKNRQMVDIGAYRSGTNPDLDRALKLVPELHRFFQQAANAPMPRSEALNTLRRVVTSYGG
jgi:flagellum-specific ATP synthase